MTYGEAIISFGDILWNAPLWIVIIGIIIIAVVGSGNDIQSMNKPMNKPITKSQLKELIEEKLNNEEQRKIEEDERITDAGKRNRDV
jgi:hypothetical protein